ncbi:MAG: hypothetical protein P0S93_05230 [Candidatus Neptunochlamydia sp.]|nr:hypothetical protein [Candidatus Neptunochlamydia sp.]
MVLAADNRKEFACHQEVSHYLKTIFYFAINLIAFEKGVLMSIQMGWCVQYLLKKQNFNDVTDEDIE